MKIDLNAPASEGFKPQEVTDDTTVASQAENVSADNEQGTATSSADDDASERRVPYSRYEKQIRARDEAIRRAEEIESRYQEMLSQQAYRPSYDNSRSLENDNDPMYHQIIKLYGDNEQAKEIYRIQKQQQEILEERAYERALEATRESRTLEAQAEQENISTIDDRIYNLEDTLGRELTETEQDRLLEIVDEFSPKDRYGNYLGGDTISFEKAWDIYEMEQARQGMDSRRSRSTATALTNSKSYGEPSLEQRQEEDKNWTPSFGNWRRRFNN